MDKTNQVQQHQPGQNQPGQSLPAAGQNHDDSKVKDTSAPSKNRQRRKSKRKERAKKEKVFARLFENTGRDPSLRLVPEPSKSKRSRRRPRSAKVKTAGLLVDGENSKVEVFQTSQAENPTIEPSQPKQDVEVKVKEMTLEKIPETNQEKIIKEDTYSISNYSEHGKNDGSINGDISTRRHSRSHSHHRHHEKSHQSQHSHKINDPDDSVVSVETMRNHADSSTPTALEPLVDIDSFYIQRMTEPAKYSLEIESNNQYNIFNASGHRIYSAGETSSNFSKRYYSQNRPFLLYIFNTKGKIVLKVERKCNCQLCFCGAHKCGTNLKIWMASTNKILGTILQNCDLCQPNFDILNESGTLILQIEGPSGCSSTDFEIFLTGQSHKKAGTVKKTMKMGGAAVSVNFPKHFSPYYKATILAALFCINFSFFESSGCNCTGCIILFVIISILLVIAVVLVVCIIVLR